MFHYLQNKLIIRKISSSLSLLYLFADYPLELPIEAEGEEQACGIVS